MRILVADDDPFSAAVMEALLVSAGHECVLATDGRAAWELLQAPDAPRIVLLDWMMPEIDGLELCRMIRAREQAEYVYVAILSVRSKQRDITLGFEAGADDFITKPYQSEDVLARIKVAERLVRTTSAGPVLRRAIDEARASRGGDVIVRTQNRVGRIIFHESKIAWAHVSDEPGSLAAILASEPSISRDDIRGVIEECGATGENFADVLVAWELISRERLHAILASWIRLKLNTIAGFPSPEVVFTPEVRATAGGVLFDPDEVLPAALLGDVPVPISRRTSAPIDAANPDPETALVGRIGRSLTRAMAIGGIRSVGVFDLRSGQCLGALGEPLDLDLVWSQLRLVSQGDLWDDLDDIMISTRKNIYIFRGYSREPRQAIFAALDRATTPLGMARRALAECVEA